MTNNFETANPNLAGRTCLFVVDVQNGFISARTEHVIPRIQSLLETVPFDITIFTQFINLPNSPYVRFLSWKRLMGDAETALVEALQPFAKEVFKKHIYTSINVEVLTLLKESDVRTAYICGIDTDCCVLQTVVDLFENGIHPYVLSYYSASNGGESSHEAALTVLSRSIGAQNIIKTEISHSQSHFA